MYCPKCKEKARRVGVYRKAGPMFECYECGTKFINYVRLEAGDRNIIHKYFDELTDRQIEVLQLLSEGFTAPEIADILYLSYYTVKNHLVKIYKCLHVSSAVEAAAYFNSKKRRCIDG